MTGLSFPMLTAQRYADATARAKAIVRERAEAPRFEAFGQSTISHYPRWLTGGLLGILAVVMTAAFVFSAGKQIAVFSLFIDGLPGQYSRLSSGWASAAIASSLLVSELGSILFAISAGVLAEGTGRIHFGVSRFSKMRVGQTIKDRAGQR